MATTPGVLYIAGYQGNGQQNFPITTEYPNQSHRFLADLATEAFVPGGLAEPPIPDFHPFYDSTASDTHYTSTAAANGAGTATITVTPSPGWTVDQFTGRICTTLAPFVGIPGFPLVRLESKAVLSNTANQITVAGNWSTLPTAHKFRVGTGRFLVYNAQPATVGASVFPDITTQGLGGCPAALGIGLGPDAHAVKAFYEKVWPSTPWFHFWKYVSPVGIYSGWRSAGSARTPFLAELARVIAAAAARGNTIDWKLIVLDVSQEDIRTWTASAPTYLADLTEFLVWLKAQLGAPGAKVQIVNHHPLMLAGTKPGGAYLISTFHNTYARNTPFTTLLDMSTAKFGRKVQIGVDPAPDDQDYRVQDLLEQGDRMADTYLRQVAGTVTTPLRGMPVYIMGGDSKCVGGLSTAFISSLASQDLLGASPTTVRPANQLVYNRATLALERYDPLNNANRSGSVLVGTAGPEITLTSELAKLHPDGFVLVKRGMNSAALSSQLSAFVEGSGGGRWERAAGENLQALAADMANVERLLLAIGMVPDYRGSFWILGTNDSVAVGGGATFAARLPQFVADVKALFQTRTSGKDAPMVWALPQLGCTGRRPEEVVAIRNALTTQAGQNSQLKIVNCDDLERDRADNLHETPTSQMETGRRLGLALTGIALA